MIVGLIFEPDESVPTRADPDHKNRYGHSPRDAANKIANGLETPFVEAVRRRLTCAAAAPPPHRKKWNG